MQKRKVNFVVICVVVLCSFLFGQGCSLFQPGGDDTKLDDIATNTAVKVDKTREDKGDVIAIVGKRKIYKSEFEAWVESNDLDLSSLDKEQKKSLLKSFVESVALAELARQRGLDKDPKVKFKVKFSTDSVLGIELLSMEAKQLTESEVKDLYAEYYAKVKSNQDPSNTKFIKYLFGNTYIGPNYTKQSLLDLLAVTTISPVERIVYEIAVDTEAEAKKVMAEFWANGASASAFRMLARQYSVLRNASSGGKKKYSELDIRRKMIEAQQKGDKKSFQDWMAFYNAVFTTPEQKPSDIINVFGKYYVIFPVQQKGGELKTWDELDKNNRQLLVNLLNSGKMMLARRSLLDEFRQANEYSINFNDL